MPLRQILPGRSQEHAALVGELLAEWNNPTSGSAEPIIVEEKDRSQRLIHVYVVWSKWSHIDRVERSEIIMEAAERRLSQPDLLNITIAMGLTPDEATRLGLRF